VDTPEAPKSRLQARAAQQCGCFDLADAAQCGVSRSALKRMRQSGVVTRVARGVYRFSAVPDSPDSRLVAALLAAGPDAAIARRSALALLGVEVPGTGRDTQSSPPPPRSTADGSAEIELVRPGSTHLVVAGATVYRTRTLPPCDVLLLPRNSAIRLTTAARSLVDLAGELPWDVLARLVDEIVCQRHASRRWLHRTALRLRSGRPGVATIARLTHPDAEGEFWSWLERTSAALWAERGLPEPEWNVAVSDDHGRIGIVDALWRRQLVVVELEGLRFHTSPAQRQADAERFNRLGKRYRLLRFTWLDVVRRPEYVVETLADALGVTPRPGRQPAG
jgi:hypothetical protein